DPPVPDLQTMEELCQPSLNGRGGPIPPIAIQATNFELTNDMIQQVLNSCQFHGLSGDDANKHLDKFLHITQSIKVNGVTGDALRLYLFPHPLTHHATSWFDRLPRNSINTFEQMAKMFLGKYFPPSMVTKLRNEITNFRQHTFYNGLTLRHRDTINAAAGGTFMKRRPEECYDLIENMTAHHNDWDTLAQRSESSSLITSFSDPEIAALKAEMEEINKNLMRVLQVNQQVKAVTPSCETCGGPHSYTDCPATVGQTQNVYAAGAYQGNSYQLQGSRNLLSYRSDNYLRPPGFNKNQNPNNPNQNFHNQNKNQGNHHPQGNNQRRNQFFQGASHGQNPPPAYQAPDYQALGYQAPANDAILKNMQTNMTSLTNSNLELKNMFGQFIKMNTASSLILRTLPSNTITNSKEDLKGITTRSGTAYQGPTIPNTSSCLPKVVERKTEPIVAPIIEPVVALVSVLKPNQKPLILYPSKHHDQKLHNKSNDQKEKIFQIFKDLDFNISFADALILMPKFSPTIKTFLTNKDKLSELARTPLNEHCSAVLLKILLEKLGDPGKFLIPCDYSGMDECLALADLNASINLMPLSVWNKLSLPELSPTCMTLELVDHSISRPIGVAEDVFVKVETFYFPTDFVVVDFDADPRICESNSHYGYECSQRVPLVSKVSSSQTLPSFPQQYPCCEDCGGLSEGDHCQPPQYTINHPIFNAHNDILNSQSKLMEQMTSLISMCEIVCQYIQKKQEEKWIEEEQAANAQYWKILACCDDDDDYNFSITPNEPVDSLSVGDEHLDTIPTTESDEFIKSSVENLVPILSESEGENSCDVHACFTTISNILFIADYEFDYSDDQLLYDEDVPEKIFSNPLFEEEIIPMKIDQHHHNAESDLMESLRTHDSALIISSKIDSLLYEFAGELILLNLIPTRIDETDCYPEEETHFTKRLLYDNSSPRPPKEFVSENSDAKIESFSPSPISDPERDIAILEELLDNYSLSLPEKESFHFDIPSFSRPPVKPPDGNTRILNVKMMGDISEQKVRNRESMTANRIDVIDMACEEYSQDVLGFSDVITSGNPNPYYDPIVSTSSMTLTPFGKSDFLLEEVDAFLALEYDPTLSEVNHSYFDPEGDILLLEAFLNDDPSLPPPNQGNYLPEVRKELKICKAKIDKSSIDEPSEVELKDLPPHLEYAFLEGDDKLPVIIAKDLSNEEKTALITVLKSHKRAIAWKLFDIKGINLEFHTHKILMEEDFKPAVQNQRRVNPKIHNVIKKEVEKLLDTRLICPISDSPWVNHVHCVPKKDGFTVVENEENELIPTRLVTGWRVCIDYRKLNEATRKYHFPLPFIDQMLERLAGNEYYCFLNGFLGYFQIPIDSKDQEKTTFTCPYGMFTYRRMPFGLCNAPGTFQRCIMAIFHDMIEKRALEHANFDLQTAGDHRKVQLNELNEFHDQAYENSLIYKKKTTRLYDFKIKDRVFNIGD
nr:reverse transcriptase domain-containing protein [Tanacetum cinerariifolium]